MPKIFPTAAAELTAARQIMSGLCETFDLEVLIQALITEYKREYWCSVGAAMQTLKQSASSMPCESCIVHCNFRAFNKGAKR